MCGIFLCLTSARKSKLRFSVTSSVERCWSKVEKQAQSRASGISSSQSRHFDQNPLSFLAFGFLKSFVPICYLLVEASTKIISDTIL